MLSLPSRVQSLVQELKSWKPRCGKKKKKERERVKKWIDGLYQGFQLLILKTGIEEKNMHLSCLNLNTSQDKLIDLVNDKSPLQSIPVNQCGKKSNIGKIAIL